MGCSTPGFPVLHQLLELAQIHVHRVSDAIQPSHLSSVVPFSPYLQTSWPMDCSMPGFPVYHQLPQLAQTHVHCIGDAIQPSHPLSSPSLPTFSLPSIRVFSSESALWIQWPKYWSFSHSIMNYHVIISLFYLNDELWWIPGRHCVYRWMCSMLVVQKAEWCRPWPQGSSLGNSEPRMLSQGEWWWPDHSQPLSSWRKDSEPGRLTESLHPYHWILIVGSTCGRRPLISRVWYNLKTALGSGIALSNIVYAK